MILREQPLLHVACDFELARVLLARGDLGGHLREEMTVLQREARLPPE